MAMYRKKPIIVEAFRWFKNGDHPDYNVVLLNDMGTDLPFLSEGQVVRYYARPDVSGYRICENCPEKMSTHGWVDTLEGGHIVCPGDWVITGILKERYPCKDRIFRETYEAI